MTQSTPTEAWLKEVQQAAEKHVFEVNGHLSSNNNDEAGNAVGTYIAGAQWQKERSAPDEQVLDHPCKQTCSGWKQGYERGRDSAQAELEEQARLNGMGSEREAKLQAENERLRKALERAELAAYDSIARARQDSSITAPLRELVEEIRKAREGKE